MPEGDTIHRAAARLRPALVGEPLVAIGITRHRGPVPTVGETISAVRAHGKHLLVDFDGGLTLRVHLRMTGSWHLYRTGERWQRNPRSARVVIEVPDWVAVCFSAPDVDVSASGTERIGHLGPDLCADATAVDDVVARVDRFADADQPVAVVLLDQRIGAGIGNVYKSEVLHALEVDPRTPIGEIPRDLRRAIYDRARTLLRANLGPGPRRTVAGGLAVYGRNGSPCGRCGHAIARFVSPDGRSTYWCPGCQRPLAPAGGTP